MKKLANFSLAAVLGLSAMFMCVSCGDSDKAGNPAAEQLTTVTDPEDIKLEPGSYDYKMVYKEHKEGDAYSRTSTETGSITITDTNPDSSAVFKIEKGVDVYIFEDADSYNAKYQNIINNKTESQTSSCNPEARTVTLEEVYSNYPDSDVDTYIEVEAWILEHYVDDNEGDLLEGASIVRNSTKLILSVSGEEGGVSYEETTTITKK